jgi:hypothetical protein
VIDRIFEVIQPDDFRMLFTGANNFRFDIAKEQLYKGNRQDFEKPYNWGTVHKYILDSFGHKVMTCIGFEADDFMAFHRFRDEPDKEYYICTRDKDLNTVPGYHFRWACGEAQPERLYFTTTFEANKFFFIQCLTGDSTDNIPGCGRRVSVMRGGPIWVNTDSAGEELIELMKVDKMVTCKKDGTIVVKTPLWLVEDLVKSIDEGLFFTEKCKEEKRRVGVGEKEALKIIDSCTTLGKMLEAVRVCYKERFPEEDWEAILLENARLLFMGSRPEKMFDWTWMEGLLHVDNTDQYNKPEIQIIREFKEEGS